MIQNYLGVHFDIVYYFSRSTLKAELLILISQHRAIQEEVKIQDGS